MAYEKEKKTAVALEYTPGEQAPKVIASGRGYLADKIIDVAKEENVPIHKTKNLPARCRFLILENIFRRSCTQLWQRC